MGHEAGHVLGTHGQGTPLAGPWVVRAADHAVGHLADPLADRVAAPAVGPVAGLVADRVVGP